MLALVCHVLVCVFSQSYLSSFSSAYMQSQSHSLLPSTNNSLTFQCNPNNQPNQYLHFHNRYKQVCEDVSMALSGKKMNMMKFQYYDPKRLDKALGKPSFPFRASTFIVDPSKAKELLGWPGGGYNL